MFAPSLLEPLSLEGYWTTPGRTQRIPGTVTYDQIDGIHLRVFGPHNEIESWGPEPEVLHGSTTDGKCVTLFRLLNHVSPFGWQELTATRLYAHWMAVGDHHFDSFRDLRFPSLSVSFLNLAAFLGQTGVTETFGRFDPASNPTAPFTTIEFRQPPPLTFSSQGFTFDTGFDVATFGDRLEQRGVRQRPWLTARAPQPVHIEDFLRTAFKSFHDLLELSAESWLPRTGIRAPAPSSRGDSTYLFCHEIRPTAMPSSRDTVELLFSAQGMGERWPVLYERWHAARRKYLPTFLLYFSLLRTPGMLLEFRFLNLVHAVEAYHRRAYRNHVLPADEYEKRRSRLLGAACPEDHDWLQQVLKYANQPRLADRLGDLYDSLPSSARTAIGKRRAFTHSVAQTRNSLSHWAEDQDNATMKPDAMWRTIEKLKLALKVILIRELGLDVDGLVPRFYETRLLEQYRQRP